MADTSIPWTDYTWNPIVARDTQTGKPGWHCEHRSPACSYCYAETLNRRFGTGAKYLPSLREAGRITVSLAEHILIEPLRWRRNRMVFPCSMTDIAGEFVPFEWLDEMHGVMTLTPQHRYQVLTKRPDRLLAWHQQDRRHSAPVECTSALYVEHPIVAGKWPFDEKRAIQVGRQGWPLPHVLVGTSVEDRRRWDERVPILREIPAATHWLSIEPLLEDLGDIDLTGIDWAVVGGLSGPAPFELAWARRILAQCREQRVPFFMKQIGTYLMRERPVAAARDHKGEEPENWPPDLRVREWPRALTTEVLQ